MSCFGQTPWGARSASQHSVRRNLNILEDCFPGISHTVLQHQHSHFASSLLRLGNQVQHPLEMHTRRCSCVASTWMHHHTGQRLVYSTTSAERTERGYNRPWNHNSTFLAVRSPIQHPFPPSLRSTISMGSSALVMKAVYASAVDGCSALPQVSSAVTTLRHSNVSALEMRRTAVAGYSTHS